VTDGVARFLSAGHVAWEANEEGYMPYLPSEDDEQEAARFGLDDVPELIDALDETDSFVKAHVALTRVTGVEYESFPTWNGLALTMDARGRVSIDPAQRELLARRWRHWWTIDPRPSRLPPGD
jgi:hypothetical protein